MWLLADKNVSDKIVRPLREQGYCVALIREDAPGTPDNLVLTLATEARRCLITFDSDFGEMVGIEFTTNSIIIVTADRIRTRALATTGETPHDSHQ